MEEVSDQEKEAEDSLEERTEDLTDVAVDNQNEELMEEVSDQEKEAEDSLEERTEDLTDVPVHDQNEDQMKSREIS